MTLEEIREKFEQKYLVNRHIYNYKITDLWIELDIDDLDLVELQLFLEDEFEIEISDIDFSTLTTVEKMLNYLEQRLNPPSPPRVIIDDKRKFKYIAGNK